MKTVRELIEELRKCDPDKEVKICVLRPDGTGDESKANHTSVKIDSVEEFDHVVAVWRDS